MDGSLGHGLPKKCRRRSGAGCNGKNGRKREGVRKKREEEGRREKKREEEGRRGKKREEEGRRGKESSLEESIDDEGKMCPTQKMHRPRKV